MDSSGFGPVHAAPQGVIFGAGYRTSHGLGHAGAAFATPQGVAHSEPRGAGAHTALWTGGTPPPMLGVHLGHQAPAAASGASTPNRAEMYESTYRSGTSLSGPLASLPETSLGVGSGGTPMSHQHGWGSPSPWSSMQVPSPMTPLGNYLLDGDPLAKERITWNLSYQPLHHHFVLVVLTHAARRLWSVTKRFKRCCLKEALFDWRDMALQERLDDRLNHAAEALRSHVEDLRAQQRQLERGMHHGWQHVREQLTQHVHSKAKSSMEVACSRQQRKVEAQSAKIRSESQALGKRLDAVGAARRFLPFLMRLVRSLRRLQEQRLLAAVAHWKDATLLPQEVWLAMTNLRQSKCLSRRYRMLAASEEELHCELLPTLLASARQRQEERQREVCENRQALGQGRCEERRVALLLLCSAITSQQHRACASALTQWSAAAAGSRNLRGWHWQGNQVIYADDSDCDLYEDDDESGSSINESSRQHHAEPELEPSADHREVETQRGFAADQQPADDRRGSGRTSAVAEQLPPKRIFVGSKQRPERAAGPMRQRTQSESSRRSSRGGARRRSSRDPVVLVVDRNSLADGDLERLVDSISNEQGARHSAHFSDLGRGSVHIQNLMQSNGFADESSDGLPSWISRSESSDEREIDSAMGTPFPATREDSSADHMSRQRTSSVHHPGAVHLPSGHPPPPVETSHEPSEGASTGVRQAVGEPRRMSEPQGSVKDTGNEMPFAASRTEPVQRKVSIKQEKLLAGSSQAESRSETRKSSIIQESPKNMQSETDIKRQLSSASQASGITRQLSSSGITRSLSSASQASGIAREPSSGITRESVTQPGAASAGMARTPSRPSGSTASAPRALPDQGPVSPSSDSTTPTTTPTNTPPLPAAKPYATLLRNSQVQQAVAGAAAAAASAAADSGPAEAVKASADDAQLDEGGEEEEGEWDEEDGYYYEGEEEEEEAAGEDEQEEAQPSARTHAGITAHAGPSAQRAMSGSSLE